MNDRDSDPNLIALVTDIQNGLARLFRERTRHIGLSRSQWRVLSAMSSRPGITQTELADLVGIGRAPVGKIIDRLEVLRWVERRSDPRDRRINRLHLTRDFRPIAEPTRGISSEIADELLADVGEKDKATFYDVVRQMHKTLGFHSREDDAYEDEAQEAAGRD